MTDEADTSLLSWDGAHLVVDLRAIESWSRRTVEAGDRPADLRLRGDGDAVRVEARFEVRGVWSRGAVELAEIRLRRRTLGFRLRRPRIFGGLPVPRPVMEALLFRLGVEGVTVFRGDGIVVVDLDRWLPPGLELHLVTAHATERKLHLWLGPGELRDIPWGARGDPAET